MKRDGNFSFQPPIFHFVVAIRFLSVFRVVGTAEDVFINYVKAVVVRSFLVPRFVSVGYYFPSPPSLPNPPPPKNVEQGLLIVSSNFKMSETQSTDR